MTTPRRTVTALAAVGAVLLSGLAGCSRRDPAVLAPVPSAAPSTSAPKPLAPPSSLTGTRPAPKGAVVALKIDNSPFARPYHRGIDRASIVYQELVEGGLTRLLAVYDGGARAEVGPIRSVRENDLELLRPFGPVAFGFSGGNPGTLRTVGSAVRAKRLLDASYDTVPRAYRLGERRRDARNFFTSPAQLAALRPKAAKERDIGLRFGPARSGLPTPSARAVFSDFSRVDVRYDASSGRWSVLQDGRRMSGVAPANVVVQRVRVRRSQYRDTNGNNSPFTITTGKGVVTVLRDGRRIAGTWQRKSAAKATRFQDKSGRDIALKPGPTWVLLVPVGGSLSFG